MKFNHGIAIVLAITLFLEILHRNFLVILSFNGDFGQCVSDSSLVSDFLTPFLDYILSRAVSAVTIIALGVALIISLRAHEYVTPARILLGTSITCSLSLNALQAIGGYFDNCTGKLVLSLAMNVLLVFCALMFSRLEEEEATSIEDSIKKWVSACEEKCPYTTLPQ